VPGNVAFIQATEQFRLEFVAHRYSPGQDPTRAPELLDAPPVTGPEPARVSDPRARVLFDTSGREIADEHRRPRAMLTADTLPKAVAAAAGDQAAICVVPPTGFEPVLPP
jgi:hypothetical protein